MKRLIAITISFLLFIPFASIHGNNVAFVEKTGNVLYVGGSGPNNYTSIQDAINAADNGYTIYVYPRQYNESIVINKSISLIGIIENGEKPVINGIENKTVILIEANQVVLKHFHILYGRGIALKNTKYCEIENNVISYSDGNGISLYNSNNNLILNNIVSNNKNEGIHISKSSYNIINKNTVKKNIWTGIVVFSDSNRDIISHNNVTDNFHGMKIGDAAYNCTVFSNNVYENKQYGITVDTCKNISILNNTIYGHAYGGLQIMDCSYCIVEENKLHDNDAGIMVQSNYLWEKQYNLIKKNNVYSNHDFGIYIEGSLLNTFTENNLMNNGYNAWFWEQTIIGYPSPIRPCHNTWNANYWSNWHLPAPKPINGVLTIWWKSFYLDLPWLNFDFHPALQPYKI